MTSIKLSTVFFDLDGTLLDTAHDLLIALNYVLDKNGYAEITLTELLPLISLGSKKIINHLLKQNITHPKLEQLRTQFITAYNKFGHQHTDFFPGIKSVLNFLNTNSIAWGIITNKTTALTLPIAEFLNFSDLKCQTIVCADTTEHAKPHSAPMLKACSDLQVDPKNCIFIGDAKTDIIAGRNVGMKTILAGYGYIPKDENPLSWGADYKVDSVMELLQLLPSLIQ